MRNNMKLGFHAQNPFIYKLYNTVFAFFLFVLVSPLIIIISICLFATQGPDILYRGVRIGKNGKTFQIYKFRTLCRESAQRITQTCALPRGTNIETPLGGFLRETRLDELPQLLNVIIGDMNILGPRPVRPEIAIIECKKIENYEMRFLVKPGLIGPTQALFAHGASKRLRARMNNKLVQRPVCIVAEIQFFVQVAWSMIIKCLKMICEHWKIRENKGSAPKRFMPEIFLDNGDRRFLVTKITKDHIECEMRPVSQINGKSHLYVNLRDGRKRRAKIILDHENKIKYAPYSEFSEYIIERYGLGLTLVEPKVRAQSIEPQASMQRPVWINDSFFGFFASRSARRS